MPQTVRKYWGPFQGRTPLNMNWDIINHDSTVLVTVSQYIATYPASNEWRFTTNASVTVQNIAPHGPPYDPNHGVTFVVNVDSPSPVLIVTDITVLDAPPSQVVYP